MLQILFGIYIFLDVIKFMIFLDVLLSLLTLTGVKFRPIFIASILDPLYVGIKKYIPTHLGPLDFTPMVLVFVLIFLQGLLIIFFPEIREVLPNYESIF